MECKQRTLMIATFSLVRIRILFPVFFFFFFNDTATTEIYTLSLHDALPISDLFFGNDRAGARLNGRPDKGMAIDRKSTRLNSSHQIISYAVFCLKKKKQRRLWREHCGRYLGR